ncbi:zinc ribbon domain-containing protein [Chloroflexota bacterium]
MRRQYLLSGLIKCGRCGYSYNARTLRNTIYYSCTSKLGHVESVSCKSHGMRGDMIEPLVWDSVEKLLSQPKLIIEQMEKRTSKVIEGFDIKHGKIFQHLIFIRIKSIDEGPLPA